jgi:cytochrome c oxidase subunit 2
MWFIAYADSAETWQLGFQDPATPLMEGIVNLHHDIMFFLVLIMTAVTWMLARTVWLFNANTNPVASKFNHGTLIEIIWTILPAVILLLIAIPSFALLYAMDEVIDPAITIKAIGHQWYWTYEYSDYSKNDADSIVFDSYMVPTDDLQLGQLRLLEVDNRVFVPVNTHIRLVVTSADVLHSWALPSAGIKIDACPGRLNQVDLFFKRPGVYFGQCSEICGVNHGFMPITVQAVSLNDYVTWVASKIA